MHKKSILKKTIQVGGSTILSRLLGLTREILQVRYMGAGAISDAFRIAWQLPNMLRQIFAEGALSAAVVPTVVTMVKQGKKESVNKFMTLSFLIFESTVLALCVLIAWQAPFIIHLITPGFSGEQALLTIRLLRILISFILFISSSALLAGALQAAHHFWIPALSSSFLNVIYITGLLAGLYFGLSVEVFCLFIIAGGLLQFFAHLWMYFRLRYVFEPFDKQTVQQMWPLLAKFLPSMISGSVIYMSIFVDNYFASFLPAGSVSIIGITSGFIRIPLGIVVSFATVLLTHFSRVGIHAPKRLSFYLLESLKLVFWLAIPATIMLMFFSEKIFYTLFLSDKFSIYQVAEAKVVLSAFLLGLFFISMNKILLSLYYSLHQLWIPALITMFATSINILLCSWWVATFQTTGLAIATSTSQAIQTLIFIVVLHKKFNFRLYHLNFVEFMYRYLFQLGVIFVPFYGIYRLLYYAISFYFPSMAHVLTMTMGLWIWVVPLCGVAMLTVYKTREFFKIRLYFLK